MKLTFGVFVMGDKEFMKSIEVKCDGLTITPSRENKWINADWPRAIRKNINEDELRLMAMVVETRGPNNELVSANETLESCDEEFAEKVFRYMAYGSYEDLVELHEAIGRRIAELDEEE